MKTIPNNYKDLLEAFIAFKSISTDTHYKAECEKTALWLQDLFHNNGFVTQLDYGEDSNPLVMAKYIVDPEVETVMVYGHYDVQPAKQSDGWQQDPFSVDIRDQKIIARGAIDNKGQVLVHISTVFDLIESGQLKYNVVFMIEGNEESGNPDILDQLHKYKDFLGADYVLISDGEVVKDRPTMESSFRGGANMTVHFKTASNDFHSGIYGGAVPSASLVAMQTLGQLKNSNNLVMVPGFYDDVKINQSDINQNIGLATEDEVLELSGVKTLLTEPNIDFYSQTGLRPTLEVSGIHSGYTDVGYLNIVPARAIAKINIRTVGNQDTTAIMSSLENYIKDITPDYADLRFEHESPSDPITLDITSTKCIEIKNILESVYNQPMAIKNVGGSIPIVANFKNDMDMNVISVSLANEDCNMHGVDENFRIEFLLKGLEFSKQFFKK